MSYIRGEIKVEPKLKKEEMELFNNEIIKNNNLVGKWYIKEGNIIPTEEVNPNTAYKELKFIIKNFIIPTKHYAEGKIDIFGQNYSCSYIVRNNHLSLEGMNSAKYVNVIFELVNKLKEAK